MIVGIFAGHKAFANAIVNAAESIIGKQKNYYCISNFEKPTSIIKEELKSIISRDNHYIIFIDFFGSSFTVLSFELFNNFDNVHLFYGYNLPVVLDFFIHRQKKTVDELLLKLKQVAINSIKYENNKNR